MADEIDRGQESGEVAVPPEAVSKAQTSGLDENPPSPATYDELGISSQRVSEWREMQAAGEEAVEDAIQQQLDEGKAPTKSGTQAILKGFTGNDEWYTPSEWTERARSVMGSIDLDPASCKSAQKHIKARRFFTAEQDGLSQDWFGKVWLNPPYSRGLREKFTRKLIESYLNGFVDEAIVLVDNRTDSGWFHELAEASDAIAFTRGRINFLSKGGASSAQTNGSVFFYFGRHPQRFKSEFEDVCLIVRRFSCRE
jgi:phage N-6-adenine-methyltransferase